MTIMTKRHNARAFRAINLLSMCVLFCGSLRAAAVDTGRDRPTGESNDQATAAAVTTVSKEPATEGQGSEPLVRYKDGRLSVAIDNRPLSEVMVALQKHLPVTLYLKDSLKDQIGQQNIYERFEDYPLQSGLRAILGETNHLLKFALAGDADSDATKQRPIEIWVLGGSGSYSELTGAIDRDVEPPPFLDRLALSDGPADLSALSEDELRDVAVNASDENARINALLSLGDKKENPKSVETFESSLLNDESPHVRWRALTRILSAYQEVSEGTYRSVINEDPDPFIRRQALAVYVFKRRHAAEKLLTDVRASHFDKKMSAYADDLIDWLAKQPKEVAVQVN